MTNAQIFGKQLALAFQLQSKVSSFAEVPLFRALMSSFGKLGGMFHVEEYHGPKHQVYFNGQGAWGRSPARCELCDVVIVSYSLSGGFRGRITFLQAKLSKEKHLGVCNNYPGLSAAVDFKANLEQWDLLSRRPQILPVPPFKVHSQVLSDALLPSVGSFGIFHKSFSKNIGFFYSSADLLSVSGTPTSKNGRLKTSVNPRQRNISGHLETVYCCCLPVFGEALYNLEIGTPIEPVNGSASQNNRQAALQSWIRNILSFYIEVGANNSILARQLRELLPNDDENSDFPESIPSLILLRSDFDDEAQGSSPW